MLKTVGTISLVDYLYIFDSSVAIEKVHAQLEIFFLFWISICRWLGAIGPRHLFYGREIRVDRVNICGAAFYSRVEFLEYSKNLVD